MTEEISWGLKLSLYFYGSSKHGQGQMHSQSLIIYCSDSEYSIQLVTASEDTTFDQNGKPSTPPHPTPSIPLLPQ